MLQQAAVNGWKLKSLFHDEKGRLCEEDPSSMEDNEEDA